MNWPNWIFTQDHIGSQYPFYSVDKEKENFSLNFKEIVADVNNDNLELNTQSVIEMLMRNYIIGDKTLVKSIKRTPWMAELDDSKNDWVYFNIPPHNNRKIDPSKAAIKLKEIIYEEILKYISNYKKVGILLSGGLDSRILAGILKETQIRNEFSGNIVVYNWGTKDSRDVWYAKQIADKYSWQYKHLPLSPETLRENFFLVLKVGAETMPHNLHAMNSVAQDLDSEVVLAGSYGDTMGRAEYNGIPLKKVPPIVLNNANEFGLLKSELVKDYYEKMIEDSTSYRNSVDKYKREEYQYREIEYQRHHSRRYLSTAMSLIAMEKPLFQLFTSPETAEYLWSLDLSIRSNTLYQHILPLLPGEISNIPWARTGKVFGSNEKQIVDKGKSGSHEYGLWLRNDLRSFIEQELDLNLLNNLGIFNEHSLESIYNIWPKSKTTSVNKLDEMISWLTSLSMFIKSYNIINERHYKHSVKDSINSILCPTKMRSYQIIRNKIRN